MSQDLQMYHLYSQLTQGKTISDALHAFKNLKVERAADGDKFFESFGVPFPVEIVLQPLERLLAYEFLLKALRNADKDKFYALHKGTSYYFLATAAFDVGDYEKAVFYLDSAFAEDIRKSEENGSSDPTMEAFNNPGGWLIRLDPDKCGPARRITSRLKIYFEKALKSFQSVSGTEISLNNFVEIFVIKFVKQANSNRSIITSLYSYIFEFEDRYKLLSLRSGRIGSIEPFLVHLFKGGLIFESLLKYAGTVNKFIIDEGSKDKGKSPKQIGGFNFCSKFKQKYCDFNQQFEDMSDLLKLPVKDMKNAFISTYNLRNITGHDLRREDIFQNPDDYKKLYDQEIMAILYIIGKEFKVGI